MREAPTRAWLKRAPALGHTRPSGGGGELGTVVMDGMNEDGALRAAARERAGQGIDGAGGGAAGGVDALENVDLTSCDREPIHILGRVQSFGLLLAVTSDWIVARVSENCERFLGRGRDDLLGRALAEILPEATLQAVRSRMQSLRSDDAVEQLYGLPVTEGGAPHDLAVYLSGPLVIVEAEPSEHEPLNSGNLVQSMISRLQRTRGTEAFEREAVRQMRALTGFDRVMLYRFDPDESGEVVAESHRSDLEPYGGLRYPASDIPKQARALYKRNWLRLIADTTDMGSPILPERGPNGEPIDLSLSTLRSVSPIHLEYLTNMGVRASMSVSVLINGELWGLFACHHMEPRRISLERRAAAELFGRVFSWILDGRLRDEDADYEARARAVHDGLMTAVAAAGATIDVIAEQADELKGIIASDGLGVWIDGRAELRGSTPTREEFAGLVRFLNSAPPGKAFATHELGRVHPPARDFTERAAGVLAIPISRQPRDYLVFFRREVARKVTWAGNPNKPVSVGPNGVRLTPRKSFDAWRETVRGQSVAWSAADRRIADALRVTLLEVILRMTDTAEKERRSAQERQELLIAELNHRVRNILGLIRGLVAQSRGNLASAEEFASVVGGRIQALARAHDQITTTNWGPGSLSELVQAEVSAYTGGANDRVTLSGPSVLLEPQAFSTVALVVHELTTNAMKYGALKDGSGRIDVAWRFDPLDRLVITWRERGGPAVQAPKRRGFGSTIIERSIPFDLKGEADLRYELTGLEARFVLPATYVSRDRGEEIEAEPPREATSDGVKGRVLVVEDNMLIALDAEDMMMELGADAVETASSVAQAMAIINAQAPDFALLDVNLGSETSVPVAERLAELGVPFVFATGYGTRPPAEFGDEVGVVSKPYTAEMLRRLLAGQGRG